MSYLLGVVVGGGGCFCLLSFLFFSCFFVDFLVVLYSDRPIKLVMSGQSV